LNGQLLLFQTEVHCSSFLCHLFAGCSAPTDVSPERFRAVGGIIPPLQAVPPQFIPTSPQVGVPVVVAVHIPRFRSVSPGIGPIVPTASAAAVAVAAGVPFTCGSGGLAAVRLGLPEAAHRHGMRTTCPVWKNGG